MPKRKAYNKNKRVQMLGDHLVRNLLLVDIARNPGYVCYHRKRKVLIEVDDMVMSALSKPHYWGITLIVLHERNGERYTQDVGFTAKERCYPADIDDLAADYRDELHKTMNPNTFLSDAWMASPSGDHIEADEVMFILDRMLAFEPLTDIDEIRNLIHETS